MPKMKLEISLSYSAIKTMKEYLKTMNRWNNNFIPKVEISDSDDTVESPISFHIEGLVDKIEIEQPQFLTLYDDNKFSKIISENL